MTLTLTKLSSPPVCTEQQLVAATRAGDDRAFEELYSRYRERISSFILGRVHDHGRAEDIAQDVFISALRRLRGSDQRIAFKPWIYEIAKNACIDEFRRASRGREVPLETDGELVTDLQPALSLVSTPAAAVESKQRLDDLRGAFGGLSPNHHQMLVMREFEGLSYEEIGDRLDMSRQMVESGLFRARRKLTQEYSELASGRRCEQVQSAIEAGTMRSVKALGLRERRGFARHLAHCQPCRHVALMAGVDEALLKPRSVAAKIAALLPFPLWRWPWRGGGGRGGGGRGPDNAASTNAASANAPSTKAASTKAASTNAASTSGHQVTAWRALSSGAGLAQPAASSISFGPAAAAVAVLAIAGGGGLVSGLAATGHSQPGGASTRAADRGHLRAPGQAGGPGAGSGAAIHTSLNGTSRTISVPSRTAPGASGAVAGGHAIGSTGAAPGSSTASGTPGTGSTGSSPSSSTGRLGTSAGAKAGALAGVIGGAGSAASHTVHTVSNPARAVSGAGKTLSGVVHKVTSSAPVSKVTSTVSGVVKTAQGAASTVTSAAAGTLSKTTSAASSAVSPVTQPLNSAIPPLKSATQPVTSATQQVKSATQPVGSAVKSATQPVNSATQTVKSAAQPVTSATQAVKSATQPVSSATQPLKSVTQALG